MIKRRTLRSPVSLEGLGLHSGVPVSVTIHPAGNGIHFRRGSYRVEATPENVSDTTRCTRLGEISTVEHLMSALAGMEITDAEIELDERELPGLDGSALEYVRLIAEAGTEEIGERQMPDLFTRVFVHEDQIKIAASKGTGHWSYRYCTGERWPHDMSFECEDVMSAYSKGIAPARTFAMSEEVPQVLAAGLGKGLKEGQVLILGERGYENEPRFEDEPARHKLLDLLGDLYLSGIPASRLNVSAERSGHRTNVAAAMQLRRAMLAAG